MENSAEFLPLQIIHHYFPKTKEDFVKLVASCGCGGFLVNINAPWNEDTPELHSRYLKNQQDFKELEKFILLCKAYSLRVWIYDEPGFPSGAAGKQVVTAYPELAVKGISMHEVPVRGGKICYEFKKGEILSVNLRSEKTGIIRAVSEFSDGFITLDLPEENYSLLITELHPLKWLTGSRVPYVDLLNPKTTQAFIKSTYQAYKDNLSEEAFSYIEAYFSDEPGLPTHGCSFIFDEEQAVIPWTEDLFSAFEEEYDYSLVPQLYKLFLDDKSYKSTKRDYWRWISKRFGEAFFAQISKWCNLNGQKFTGHLYGEENLAMQTALNGSLFNLECKMTIPGVDRLFCTHPRMILPEKTASSAADLMGYKQVMSESSAHFEQALWKHEYDIDDVIHSFTYQYVLGVNTIASYFSVSEFRENELKKAYEYIAKVGKTTKGIHKAQILLLLPTEEAWGNYRPLNYKCWSVDPSPISIGQPQDLIDLDVTLNSVMEIILDSQLDFDLINYENLLAKTQIKNGKIETSFESFDVFAFIDNDNTPKQVYNFAKNLASKHVPVIMIKTNEKLSLCGSVLKKHCPNRVAESNISSLSKIALSFTKPYLAVLDSSQVWIRTTVCDNALVSLLYCHSQEETKVTLGGFLNNTVQIISPLENTMLQKDIKDDWCEITFPKKAGIIIKQKLIL